MKTLMVLPLFWLVGVVSPAYGASPPSPSPPPLVSPPPPVSPSASQGTIKVQTYEVEVAKTITIPATRPTRYLVADPGVASVREVTPTGLVIETGRIGSTLLIWWETEGIRSAQIVVTYPTQQLERIKEIEIKASELYQSRRARSFKITYDLQSSRFAQEKVLSRVDEIRKVLGQEVILTGNTPLGDFKGTVFYEYRKDNNLRKSVGQVRDLWMGLLDTDLPWGRLLDGYDMMVGRQYVQLTKFGFPGARLMGFSMVPSERRIETAQRGQWDFSFFVGRERRGGYRDNPAGTNARNLKLKNRFMGEKLDFYLWDKGKIWAGAYHKWGGETNAFQSKSNYDFGYDFTLPLVRLEGEVGTNQRTDVAMRFGARHENPWAKLGGEFFRVSPQYRTVTGTAHDKGRRGFKGDLAVYPLKPWWKSEAIRIRMDGQMGRDLVAQNPRRPEKLNRELSVDLDWWMPWRLESTTSFDFQNEKATSFPYTRKRVRERLSRDFSFNSRWVRRLSFFGRSTWDRFGDAEATPGFNSRRWELGGGTYVSLLGDAWVSAEYLWNRLDEKEPNPAPDGRTYPGRMTLAGGISHSFHRIPLNVNFNVRYTDERKEVRKLHQPFSSEDRFEVRGSLNLRLSSNSVLFVEGEARTIRPLTGDPEIAELSVVMGTRVNVDTHLYFPQKGTIEGTFFLDQNANGIRDPGEPGVSGYEIFVEGGPRTRTNGDGDYRLRVKEGVVQLIATSEIPEGYFYTTLNQHKLEILPKKELRIDFGIVPQTQIKGRAYLDANENKVFDDGDIAMPEIQIVLDSGQLVVTSADGFFSFIRVAPGPNQAEVVLKSIPTGYRTLTPVEREFTGMPGDILIFDVAMTADRSVSGSVFKDTNRNGRREAEEEGVGNVVVRSGDQRATSSADGRYVLSGLKAGMQKIMIDLDSLPENMKAIKDSHEINVSKGFFVDDTINFPLLEEPQPSISETSSEQNAE